MPINPYANQMAVMQAQGIPTQAGGPPATVPQPPAATPPVATPPATPPVGGPGGNAGNINERIAQMMAQRGMHQQAMQDWRSQRPTMDVRSPDFRAALQQWRSSRPQRAPFGANTPPNPAAVSGLAPNG